MGHITIQSVIFSPPSVTIRYVTIETKLASDPDSPAFYTLQGTHVAVLPSGDLSPDFIIDGLEDGVSYTVKITLECSGESQFGTFTTGQVFTKCVGCGLGLSGVSGGQIGAITVGNLTSSSCTLGDYVIDWHLDSPTGPIQFTSGNNALADPSITIIHPIVAEPAFGGVYYPVIKKVVLDGTTYLPIVQTGINYSPDLLGCLGSITVQNFTCTNGSVVNQYMHSVSYTNTLLSSLFSARVLRFDLSPTTQAVAWRFDGQQVPDNVILSYVSPLNNTQITLTYFTIGLDVPSNNYAVSPKTLRSTELKHVVSLSGFTYTAGDYIRVAVTPNVGNTNTNWTLEYKCLDSYDDCPTCDPGLNRKPIPGTEQLVWNASTCSWDFSYQRVQPCLVNPDVPNVDTFAYYHSVEGITYFPYNPATSTTVTYSFLRGTTGQISPTHGQSNTSCRAAAGGTSAINWVKSGTTLTATFLSLAEYNNFKTRYNLLFTFPQMANYTTLTTSVNYYKFFRIALKIAPTCGDSYTTQSYITHRSNTFVFNDSAKTATITIGSVTNDFVDVTCSTTYETIQSYVTIANQDALKPDINVTTGVTLAQSGEDVTLAGYPVVEVTRNEMSTIFGTSWRVKYNTICDLASAGWTLQDSYPPLGGYPGQYMHIGNLNRISITDNTDPANNFKLETLIDDNGIVTNPITYQTLYEIHQGTTSTTTTTTASP